MREDLANLVHPVLAYGLALRDRLEAGELPNLEQEQAALKALLLTDEKARWTPDFGGEGPLGARYALVCWLDELFGCYSSWATCWNARTLEEALYHTRDGQHAFWDQAELIAQADKLSVLEVYYLCVALGFRGARRTDAPSVWRWAQAVTARLSRRRAWTAPPELEPPAFVPPLRGRAKVRRMLRACGLVLALLVPVAAFFVVRHLAG
jgi:type VI secretion system protein ImpK